MTHDNTYLAPPTLPSMCPPISTDRMALRQNMEYLRNQPPDVFVQEAIFSLMDSWKKDSESVRPLTTIKDLMDTMRTIPRSEQRLKAMNTFVKTLSNPEFFATFLDMLGHSSKCGDIRERDLSEVSRKSSKHAVYGWCGQTRLSLSDTSEIESTVFSEPGVQEFLGKTPTAAWSLSMHIWQPNRNAAGFQCGQSDLPNVIAEPPHSHPFDFASAVVIGQIHQSIYVQKKSSPEMPIDEVLKGRYDGIELEHVHGVWPPHSFKEKSFVETMENRVVMNAGDSYFMSADTVHDVQVDRNIAKEKPAITLFLRSESFVRPHVYMAREMADFHDLYPDLKSQGYPLEEKDWHRKLEMVSDYVRGKSEVLNLDEIVKYDNEYAFFHV